MDRKLKTIYLSNIICFILFLFGNNIKDERLSNTSILVGLSLSSYLALTVKSKKVLEDEKVKLISELESKVLTLSKDKEWLEELNSSESKKLLNEHFIRESKLRELISSLNQKIELLTKNYLEEITKLEEINQKEKNKLLEEFKVKNDEKENKINNLVLLVSQEKEEIKEKYELQLASLKEELEKYKNKEDYLKSFETSLNVKAINFELSLKELELKEKNLEVKTKEINLEIDKKLIDESQKLKEAESIIRNLSINQEIQTAEISRLKKQLADYHLMIFAEKSNDDYLVKTLQQLLLESEINTDYLKKEEKQDGKIITVDLKPISTFDNQKLKRVCEQLPGFLNLTKTPEYKVCNGRIIFTIDKRTSKEKAKANQEFLESKLITLENCVGRNLGFLIIGEPGSAKTTGALAVANTIINQELSNKALQDLECPESAMLLALDIHHTTSWDNAGIKVIDDPYKIYEQFKLLQQEYDSRKPGKKTNRLIIFFDEIVETLDRIKMIVSEIEGSKTAGNQAVEYIQNLYRSFGTGGRKKYINFIGMNHSYNTKALGIDGYYRNCFVSILLNDACRHYVNTVTKHMSDSKKTKLYDWVELMKDRYIALATGAIEDELLKHPTHHDYKIVKDGNPPNNLKPIKQLSLDIKLVN